MTIAIAWIRKIKNCEELVFVSDSRLSGDGRIFDGCPKILTLPRNDCVISFTGYTGHAFPMMLQLALAIESHAPSKRGALELSALRTHLLKVFEALANQIQDSPHVSAPQNLDPEATFLFGGYSWVLKRFQLWIISYRPREKRFVADPANWFAYSDEAGKIILRKKKNEGKSANLGRIVFAGDQASLAKKLLLEKLNEDGKGRTRKKPIDMEPFEVVRDMLRDPNHSETIGGAPQIIKVYQYMRTAPLAVYWPNKERGSVHLQGRPCLGYERVDRWVLDPDTLMSDVQPLPAEASVISPEEVDGV